jgi:hypothetical protein
MTTTSKKVSEVIENLQRARLTLPKDALTNQVVAAIFS